MKNPEPGEDGTGAGGPLAAFEAVVEVAAQPAHASSVAALRRAFEARTGAFGPEDAWFEARSRAFWDDAVTRQGFARKVESGLSAAHRAWVAPLGRAHRGLFRATHAGRVRVLVDVWSGAEFFLHAVEGGLRDAIDVASGVFDGRVVARDEPLCVAILPGAVFHPADATEAVLRVLDAGRLARLDTHTLLDALLKMEHSLRSLSRVKAAYAYRTDHLAKLAPGLTDRPSRAR